MKREEAMHIMQMYKDEIGQRIDKADEPDLKDVYQWQMDGFDMAIEALQGDMYCPNCGTRLVPENEYLEPTPTHGRLIDADALYEYITNKVGGVDCAVLLDNEIAPTVQADRPHGEWIPVTERLPKIDETLHLCDQISEEVLGTDTYGNIRHVYLTTCGYLKPTFCTVEEGMSVDIVAWMPLPESYEEVSDGKD